MDNTALVVFSNEEFGKVRGLMFNGIPYFAGKDITEALEYQDTDKAIREHVDDDDKVLFKPADLAGLEYEKFTDMFSQEVAKENYIPENMFYRLAMKANNLVAEKFQAKVADEILPTIRDRLVNVEKVDDIIQTLQQQQLRHERSFVS